MSQDICSIWAYEDIKRSGYLGHKQALVLSVFAGNPNTPMKATDVVESLGRTVSETTRTRISELERMGFLRKYDRVVCDLTKKTVNRWIYTGNRKPLSYKKMEVCCIHCKGKGTVIKKIYDNPEEGSNI